ncbi:hypothetical protein C8R45DRAFT_118689 [Mycena sanguinolenta]|nr:hypothetical protein C8R45DRAFT_118689 [Mycena sanguinolenta]
MHNARRFCLAHGFCAWLHILLGIGPALSSALFSVRRRSAGAPHCAAALQTHRNKGATSRRVSGNSAAHSSASSRRVVLGVPPSAGDFRVSGALLPVVGFFRAATTPLLQYSSPRLQPPSQAAPDFVKAHAGQLRLGVVVRDYAVHHANSDTTYPAPGASPSAPLRLCLPRIHAAPPLRLNLVRCHNPIQGTPKLSSLESKTEASPLRYCLRGVCAERVG